MCRSTFFSIKKNFLIKEYNGNFDIRVYRKSRSLDINWNNLFNFSFEYSLQLLQHSKNYGNNEIDGKC